MEIQQNEREFARLIYQHKDTIYTVCYMFSKDEAEVSDLYQEVLVNLWKGLAVFKGNSNVRTWIYRVALNTCISQERKKKRHKTIPLSMDINPFTDNDSDSKQIRQLNHRISRLAPFDRAIVLLWLENMSYDEIGSIVGITAKNVSVRLVRIKEQLKSMKD